jgi:predicted ATPase/class 3 adenylate cyclase
MEFRILGPLEVYSGGIRIDIGGSRRRALLGLLIIRANRVVPAVRLAEELWDGAPPRGASATLQGHISGLRGALGRGRVVTRSGGYLLRIDDDDEVDANAFERDLVLGRQALAGGDPAKALSYLREGLARWRGAALGALASVRWARVEAVRLEDLRLVALETLIETHLSLEGEQDEEASIGTLSPDAAGSQQPPRTKPAVPGLGRLPHGTVTFLMTDVENSTRLWEVDPPAMGEALARHDDLLRNVIECHRGRVLSHLGDGMLAVFAGTTEAVTAAAEGQLALGREGATRAEPLPVRMALLTGEAADERDDNYFGPALNRCARLLAIAHGGQVIMSGATADVLRDSPVQGLTCRSLGEHRLRDVVSPERVSQLVHDALPSEFPPLRSLDAEPTYLAPHARPGGALPAPLSSFIGREAEVEAVLDIAKHENLVSLTGSGGCGKTRLGLAVAKALSHEGQSVRFVGLESVEEPRHVPAAFAEAFSMPDPHRASAESVIRFASQSFADVPQLIVVDNCEHLLEPTASLIADALRWCPTLRVLATSREPLGIAGERTWLVPGLSVPPDETGLDAGKTALNADSVALFMARAHLAELTLDDHALRIISRICRNLDGIPLAIELAASAATTLPLAELERRLAPHLESVSRHRGTVPRHRSLAATMQWSFSLLTDSERRMLADLTVFAGTLSLDAALAVADQTVPDVPSALGELVRKSLVSPHGGPGGIERYQLLSTVRELAAELLGTPDNLDAARRLHAMYFRALAEDADRDVHGPRAGERLRQIAAELPNLRAALRYSIAEGDLETGARLAGALRWFFGRLCILDEAKEWLTKVLARRDELSPILRLRALGAAGTLAFTTGHLQGVAELVEEAVDLAAAIGNTPELAMALSLRGTIAAYTGQFDRAAASFAEAEPLWRDSGDHYGLGWLLTERAVVLRRTGDLDRANACLHAALDEFDRMGDAHSMIMPTLHLGLVSHQMGRLEEADRWCNQAAELARQIGDRQYLHLALCCQGRVTIDRDDLDGANRQISTALYDLADAEHLLALAIAMEGLAIIAARHHQYRDSVVLWGFAEAVRQRSLLPLSQDRSDERERWLAVARTVLGAEGAERAWQQGTSLTREEALGLGVAAEPMNSTAGYR